MISSIANLVHELPNELPNDLRLRILGNKAILGKSQIWVETQPIAQSPPEIKLWQQQSKNTQKQISNFSCPVQFYWIPLACSKYLAQIVGCPIQLPYVGHMIPNYIHAKKLFSLSSSFIWEFSQADLDILISFISWK